MSDVHSVGQLSAGTSARTLIASVDEQGALVEWPKVLEALPLQRRVCGSFDSGNGAVLS